VFPGPSNVTCSSIIHRSHSAITEQSFFKPMPAWVLCSHN